MNLVPNMVGGFVMQCPRCGGFNCHATMERSWCDTCGFERWRSEEEVARLRKEVEDVRELSAALGRRAAEQMHVEYAKICLGREV